MSDKPVPIFADYSLFYTAPKKRVCPEDVATFGTMTRRWPVTLADIKAFHAELAEFIAAIEREDPPAAVRLRLTRDRGAKPALWNPPPWTDDEMIDDDGACYRGPRERMTPS